MTALTALRDIQIGDETTPGTAVPATEVIHGAIMSGAYTDIVIHQPEEDRNTLSFNLANDFVVGKEVELSMEGNINTRILAYMLSNTIRGNITPTQPDVTNEPLAYLWTFQPGLTTANTPDIANGIDTFTIEYGDNEAHYETEYCFTTSLAITGAANEPVTYTWDMMGRQVTATTKTAALTEFTTQKFPSNLAKFYLDTSYAGIGGTQLLDTVTGWTWTLATEFTVRQTTDGVLYFTGLNESKKFAQLEVTFLNNASELSELVKHNARTTSYIRVECNGATELDSGQSNPPYLHLDAAYRSFEWGAPEDEEGAQTTTITYQSVEDITSSMNFEAALLTELDAYPT